MAKAENVPGTDEKSEKKSAPSLSHNITGRRLILTSYFRRYMLLQPSGLYGMGLAALQSKILRGLTRNALNQY